MHAKKNKSRKARTDSGEKKPNSKLEKVPCVQCKQIFSNNSNMQRHVKTEPQGLVFTCHLCDKKFNSNHARQTHITSHHGGKKPFQCKICQKEFSQQQSLSRHKTSELHKKAEKRVKTK